MYKAVIITIGDELLIGQTIDTNSAFIAQQLNKIGVQIWKRTAIADDKEAIENELNQYISKADFLVLTGGLGPTSDDITKKTLCDFFGGTLVRNQAVEQFIRSLFEKRNIPILDKNLDQALLPSNCTVLKNTRGTASGMWFEKDQSIVVSLPGVPFEMEGIFTEELLPRLQKRFTDFHILHEHLICIGKGESVIAQEIEDIEAQLPAHIHLSYLPSPGLVKLRLTTQGKEKEKLLSEILQFKTLLKTRLESCVVAEKDANNAEILVDLLKSKQLTLGTAESCTAGNISSEITNIPGSSAVLKGGIACYANDVKHHLLSVPNAYFDTVGAVSSETVIALAENARKQLSSDIAVATSGIFGPSGGTPEKPVGTVWMAVSNGEKTVAKKFTFTPFRNINKMYATANAMNFVIRFIRENY